MTDQHGRTNMHPAMVPGTHDDQRRELELELIKVRAEAAAARLEARAAELELTIRRMSRSAESVVDSQVETAHENIPASLYSAVASSPSARPMASEQQPSQSLSRSEVTAPPNAAFASWDAVRSAPETISQPSAQWSDAGRSPQALPSDTASNDTATNNTARSTNIAPTDHHSTRTDPAEPNVRRPHVLDFDEPLDEDASAGEGDDSDNSELVAPLEALSDAQQPSETVGALAWLDAGTQSHSPGTALPLADVDIDPDAEAEESERRRSPAAMLVSTVLHVLILIALAAFSMRDQSPKDQVALAASVSNPNEVSMETFEIETSEPESEPTEPSPSETEYELSPLGDMKVADFSPDAPPAPPSPMAAMMSSAQMSAAAMTLKSDSDAKIQFCGVEGGGNHFVYLVDSSGSMGSAFESARSELIKSIDVLKPEQRFYVIFFDAESDYMRLSDPNQDESRSVYATRENKQALKRWAMRITKDRGRAPYDPLKFALKLNPDVIFLLSDGEFPQGIEDLLKETNRVENLFGDSDPISIVHTIGYYSREGESRMKRIAQQNQGQYRHVPKP